MPFLRPSRLVAAIVMLVGMLIMQISIAACRCPVSPAEMGAAAGMQRVAAEADAHGAPDHQLRASCDDCAGQLELAKKLGDSTDHPRVAPFTPSALQLVLDRETAASSPPLRPDRARDRIAGAPRLHIQHCSYQI